MLYHYPFIYLSNYLFLSTRYHYRNCLYWSAYFPRMFSHSASIIYFIINSITFSNTKLDFLWDHYLHHKYVRVTIMIIEDTYFN